ncbi:TPA: hypothetical protein MAQ81_004574 [Klebsiella pneumoniae]|nr:hypothetical protein [Klebsiella pneumoniae]
MARTKGAVGKGVDNEDVRDYLLAHGPLSHQPHIVDHSLRGAKGQEKDSHRYSNERIFAMLRQLDYINATTVFNQMQAYNNSKGKEKDPSVRNVQRVTRVLRCASEAIRYHAEKWRKKEYGSGVENVCVLNFSDEERERFRQLVMLGEMDKAKVLADMCGFITRTYECPKVENQNADVIDLNFRKNKRELMPLTQIIKEIGNHYVSAIKAA